MADDIDPPTVVMDKFKAITRDDVTDESLMPGLFRELSRQVGITNSLIEHKVIPGQVAQTHEIHDLREQVTTVVGTVNEFDNRLYAFDRRIAALEEINKAIEPAREAYPKLIERVSSLEEVTGDLKVGVLELRGRPMPQRIRGVYLAAVFLGTLIASVGMALALR